MGYLISAHLMKQRPGSSLLRAALPKSIGFAVYEHAENYGFKLVIDA